MAVTTRPFVNGAIGASTRAISWCPISPTKIALVYWATSGGLRRYFIQMVNFIDKQAVYGIPCQVCVQTVTANSDAPMMRLVKIADNRLALAVPEVATTLGLHRQWSFVLIAVNQDDTVERLFQTDVISNTAVGNSLQPQLPIFGSTGNGIAYFGGDFTTAAGSGYTYASLGMLPITLADDKLTVGAMQFNLNTQSASQYPYYTAKRNDLSGKPWIVQQGDSTIVWQLDTPGALNVSSNSLPLGSDWSLKALLPIRKDKFAQWQGTTLRIRQFTRQGGAPAAAIIGVTAGLSITMPINASNYSIEDAIWLNDQGMFMFVAGEGAPVAAHNNLVNGDETLARMSTNINLFIGQYNELDDTVTLADTFPIALNLSMSKVKYDNMLHKIDEGTVACIGSFCAIGDITPAHSILVIST